jgi:regulator of replication initiation timing
MMWKKALALIGIVFVVALVALFLINLVFPNWITASAITILTVIGPAYILSKIEWVIGSITAVIVVIGGAISKIGSVKKTATAQVTQAQQQTSEATSNVNSLLTENQNLLIEKTNLTTENTALKTQLETTTPRISELETQNKTLQAHYDELRDLVKVNGIPADASDGRVIDAATPKVA